MKIHIISHDILLSDIVDTIASFFHADITVAFSWWRLMMSKS